MKSIATAVAVALLTCAVSSPLFQARASAESSAGTEPIRIRLPEALPDRPGAYLWCDDFQLAIDSVLDYLSKMGPRDDLAQLLSQVEQYDGDARPEAALRSAAKVMRLLQEGVFSSQAVWLYASDDGETYYHSFIAESTSPAEDIQELMDALQALASLSHQQPIDESGQASNEQGHWSYDGGWFIWSQSLNELENLRSCIANGNNRSLADSRSFQRVSASMLRHDQGWPAISLFVSHDLMPQLLVFGNPFKELLDASCQPEWGELCNAAFVNEIRGLGGHIYVPNDAVAERLDWALAFDLFVPVTAPRHGVFAAMEHREGITFDVPVLDKPLAQFAQIEVNGERLAHGIQETNDRVLNVAELVYAFGRAAGAEFFLNLHSLDRMDGPSSHALLRATRRVLSVEYFESPPDEHAWRGPLDIWNAIEIGHDEPTRDLVTDVLNEGQADTWTLRLNEETAFWSIARDVGAVLEDNLEERLQESQESGILHLDGPITFQISAANLERSEEGGGLVIRIPDLFQIMRDKYRNKLDRYRSQAYVSVGDWLFIHAIRSENLDRIQATRRGTSARQLSELRSTYDLLNSEFEISPCGILAQWPARLWRTLGPVLQYVDFPEPSRSPEGATAEHEESSLERLHERLAGYRHQFADSLDKLVVVLEDGNSGLRLVGVIARKSAEAVE